MDRRAFLEVLAGTLLTAPFAAEAQGAIPLIGFLSSRSPRESAHLVAAFRGGLKEAGYVDGENVQITFRWANGEYDRLPSLATDLVDRRVAVVAAAGGPASPQAAKAVTSSTPIVFTGVDDPVTRGLVQSLAHPGGNVTGVGLFANTLGPKRLELLRELLPNARRVALLVNPTYLQPEFYSRDLETAARSMGQQILVVKVATRDGFEAAFSRIVQERANALIVQAEPFFDSQRDQLVKLAARHRLPTVYGFRDYATAGGLISYGTSIADAYRQAGLYTGRILKGEKPADLPVMEPTKFELVINLKTAKALGLTIPSSLLARADQVIE
jgi:putative tryptophan/tyrosine transport system substrate-binding protein